MPVQALLLLFPGRMSERFPRLYWRGVAWVFGLRLRVIGQCTTQRPAIFVANHCSWLDIVVLGAVLPGFFIAKGEIARWPLIGWLARLGRAIFVSRSRTTLAREQAMLTARLAKGDNIILFPEGTTSDGRRTLPFASSFLAAVDSPARPAVQPVTVVYDELDFLPVRHYDRPEISWYGDMELFSHYGRIGRRRQLHVTILFDPVIAPGAFAGRKALSKALEALLAGNAAALRQGRHGQ